MEYCITVKKKGKLRLKGPQLLFAQKIKCLSAKISSQFHLYHKTNVFPSNIKEQVTRYYKSGNIP